MQLYFLFYANQRHMHIDLCIILHLHSKYFCCILVARHLYKEGNDSSCTILYGKYKTYYLIIGGFYNERKSCTGLLWWS